jgi:hypothetical protein
MPQPLEIQLYPSGPAEAASLNPGGAIEALVGETLEVRVPGTFVSVTAKVNPGTGAAIASATITFSGAGRYEFDVTSSLGRGHFYVTCCETTCTAKLPASKSAREKRMMLRSLATAGWFSGLASELVNRPLGEFGG